MPLPDAVIFDFDGVLVDSERLHHQTLVDGMEGVGPDTSWDFYRTHLMGMDDRDAFTYLLKRAGVEDVSDELLRDKIEKKAALFAARAAAGGVKPLPGALELVAACSAAGPVALCSGALRSDIVPILTALGVWPLFSVCVTAEDVAHSKPEPESYRLCLDRLRAAFPERVFTASSCVAVEDTPDGIASATGAGIPVLAVTTNVDRSALSATAARAVVDSLQDVASPEELFAITRPI